MHINYDSNKHNIKKIDIINFIIKNNKINNILIKNYEYVIKNNTKKS